MFARKAKTFIPRVSISRLPGLRSRDDARKRPRTRWQGIKLTVRRERLCWLPRPEKTRQPGTIFPQAAPGGFRAALFAAVAGISLPGYVFASLFLVMRRKDMSQVSGDHAQK